MNQTVSTHCNSQGERLHIKRIVGGQFDGQHLLIIQDDPPPHGSNTEAPMLLDEQTREWLMDQISRISYQETHKPFPEVVANMDAQNANA